MLSTSLREDITKQSQKRANKNLTVNYVVCRDENRKKKHHHQTYKEHKTYRYLQITQNNTRVKF